MSFYLLFNATLPGARRYSRGASRLRGPQDSVLCLQATGQPHASCATRRRRSSQASPHPEGLLPQPTEGEPPLGHCNFLPHQDARGTWMGGRGPALSLAERQRHLPPKPCYPLLFPDAMECAHPNPTLPLPALPGRRRMAVIVWGGLGPREQGSWEPEDSSWGDGKATGGGTVHELRLQVPRTYSLVSLGLHNTNSKTK